MAKKIGPKEEQLKALRESAAKAGDLAFDIGSIMVKIENFKREQVAPIREELLRLKSERDTIEANIDKLERLLAQLEGRAASSSTGKRTKRSADELKAHADEILSAIKAKGKEGASASDLKSYDYGQSLTAFMAKYGGHKLRTTGSKAATKYFAE